jgi:NAD(P)-dependent dehydrogenase (short-subunit alcohol dehydrogenase family)
MTKEITAEPRVALVTGANKGIGLETVRRLVQGGFRVYLASRDEELGRAAATEVGAEAILLDVRDDTSVANAADVVRNADGHLDLLVNNAGITGPLRDIHDFTAADLSEVLLTNVGGYLRVMHAFLPMLEASADPRIINVSSGLGSFGLFHNPDRIEATAGTPLYAASKAAINMLTARYARLLPHIRITIADPGMTATDLSGQHGHSVHDGTDDPRIRPRRTRRPLRRLPRPRWRTALVTRHLHHYNSHLYLHHHNNIEGQHTCISSSEPPAMSEASWSSSS